MSQMPRILELLKRIYGQFDPPRGWDPQPTPTPIPKPKPKPLKPPKHVTPKRTNSGRNSA